MAQMLSRGGSDAPATEVLTVADLLSRNAPVPVKIEVDEATAGISVGALLRREGRAPHAADRTLQPRPHQQAGEPADEERGSDRRTMVRRGAIAAGTLLAAGSVFGAAILTDVTPTGNDTGSGGGTEDDGPYAGQGLLDPEAPVVTPPDSVAIDQAASADPLDPGPAAPTAWIPVAFPGALVGAEGGDGTPATDGDDPGSGDPRSGSGDDDSPAAAANGGDETARSSGGASTVSDTDSSRSDSSSSDSSLLDRSVLDGSDSGDSEDDAGSSDNSGSSDGDSDSGSDDDDEDRGLVGGLLDTTSNLLFGSNDEDDSNQRSSGDEDEGSDSFSFFSAADEGTSAPQDEDDGESKSVESSSDDADDSDSGDSDSGDGSGDDGDSGDDGGLVGAVGGTVGSLLS